MRSSLLELASWGIFVLLEVSPKLSLLDADVTKREWWAQLVEVYETIVYNPAFDLNQHGWWLFIGFVVCVLYIKRKQQKLKMRELQFLCCSIRNPCFGQEDEDKAD